MFVDNNENVNIDWEDPKGIDEENPKADNKELQQKDTNKEDTNNKKSQTSFFLSLNYWQKYFDINEIDMKQRLISMKNPNSIELSNIISEKMDLYGPFWISTTIIFLVFAFGNLSRYFSNLDYKYEFIASSCSLIWGYSIIIPFIIYFILKFKGSNTSLMNLICVYGYSLLYFMPFIIISAVPIRLMQWLLLLAGGVLSGLFLKQNTKNILSNSNEISIIILSVMAFLFQLSLAVFIKISFYYN